MTTDERSFSGSRVRHGTESGWRLHQQRKQDPCPACYTAKSADDARRRSAPGAVVKSRLAAKAQSKARTRLTHMYPTLYAALYAEEKAKLGL